MMRSSEDGAYIDVTALERMARVARGFPGRTISIAPPKMALDSSVTEPPSVESAWREGASHLEAARCVLRIDGVAAAEIVDRYLKRA